MDIPRMKPLNVMACEGDGLADDGHTQSRKRVCRNKEMHESPMCVASMATQFIPDNMYLNSPKSKALVSVPIPAAAAPEEHSETSIPDMSDDVIGTFLQMHGMPLMEALKKTRADQVLRFNKGYLHTRAAPRMTSLYNHVLEQGDVSNGAVYGDCTTLDRLTQLPHYYPRECEGGGPTRQERMLLALEADAWQWCDIAEEDFSLLDALVWMGVQMRRLFEGE